MANMRPDLPISFNELTDGRLEHYDVIAVVGDKDINGRPTATLLCDDTTVLVRTDKNGIVDRFIPTSIDQEIDQIFHSIASTFHVAFVAGSEDLHLLMCGDLE